MFRSILRMTGVVACSTLVLSAFLSTGAFAHGVAGKRVFPTTLTIDDPAVADEASLPTFQYQKHGANNDDNSFYEYDINGEYDKRITEHVGIAINYGYTIQDRINQQNRYGFSNLNTTLKWQFLQNAPHELLMSAGVIKAWGGTGANAVGAANKGSTTPTVYFGKGFGDLPDALDWLKPFAFTGTLGYQFQDSPTNTSLDPDSGNLNRTSSPDLFVWGASLQYSIPYLQANIKDLGLPSWLGNITPIIETNYNLPITRSNGTNSSGTISPGFIWSGESFQVGLEALIPGTKKTNNAAGFIFQIHYFFDDIFPNTLGKPLVDWFN
jgi:hypothetical protein